MASCGFWQNEGENSKNSLIFIIRSGMLMTPIRSPPVCGRYIGSVVGIEKKEPPVRIPRTIRPLEYPVTYQSPGTQSVSIVR